MRKLQFISFILGLGLAAIPASATITYTYCDSGCTSTGGSYSSWQTQASSSVTGIVFTSQISFVASGLSAGGIYTDATTGTVFTNYTSGGSVDTSTAIGNSTHYLVQGTNGTGTGFEIDLPANTYAFSMNVAGCSSFCNSLVFGMATAGLGTQASHGTAYGFTLPSGGPTQFFGVVSDAPITSIFLASTYNNAYLGLANFEIGQASGMSEAPEGSTFAMIGGGLIALYLCRKPRRRKARNIAIAPQPLLGYGH